MISCATEQSFYELWHERCSEALSPTAMAEQGGRLADRPAWVFIGAYQGAVRQAFPQLRQRLLSADEAGAGNGVVQPSRWASYLVSEAREAADEPTCLLTQNAGQLTLRGTKNWTAAAPHLGWLVIKAYQASGPSTNLCLAANEQGVQLIDKPGGRFLPELQVGRAQFDDVPISPAAVLAPAENVAHLFGLIEARCLLVALAGHFVALAPNDAEPQQSLMLSSGLVTAELGSPGSVAVLLESMTLLAEWFADYSRRAPDNRVPASTEIQTRWVEDARLLQMHRPLLERSLGSSENQ